LKVEIFIYLFAQIAIEAFKLLIVILFNLILFVIFNNIKQSFLDKLQAKKILVKNKMHKILLLLLSTTSTKSIYNIVVAKKISNCLNNIINI